MSDTVDQLTVYSDHVCPFCYLGRRSLETYEETRDDPLCIEWHPFDLRSGKRGPDGEIDHTVDDGKDEDYYEQARQNVERLQDEYGVDDMLNLDEVPETDSLPAQIASYYVDDTHPDAWRAFDDAILEALWIDGRDIGSPDVLADVAASVGLDGDEIREVAADETRRDELEALFADARRRGVTGVPTFTTDEHAARGAVPPAQLERLVEGV
ncbi:putative dithiol-disulfide isomerase involved in polyketide biosynthesis [Halovivax ruber XH-70]|uniref:Putative dithiol-disulfide isomerase involved in polyketide biosynthesis n=1 Tax=Halovivax ruber (strain DSM 18193 / JCM 13892 / XH-70) TaxID=797302 RepID=L0IF59_HALRX|nr:DsbA family oxidoreductase [Halovivax ruber]AGB16831.1 putative dithiol-disulfide isomerase involved in polyketide biosynthesis [Halovivax ruber XH-70]